MNNIEINCKSKEFFYNHIKFIIDDPTDTIIELSCTRTNFIYKFKFCDFVNVENYHFNDYKKFGYYIRHCTFKETEAGKEYECDLYFLRKATKNIKVKISNDKYKIKKYDLSYFDIKIIDDVEINDLKRIYEDIKDEDLKDKLEKYLNYKIEEHNKNMDNLITEWLHMIILCAQHIDDEEQIAETYNNLINNLDDRITEARKRKF